MRERKRFLILICLLLVVALGLLACGAGHSEPGDAEWYDNGTSDGASRPEDAVPGEESAADTSGTGESAAQAARQASQRKIVFTANYEIETTQFDQDWAAIQGRIAELGGYIENSRMEGKPPEQRDDGRRVAMVSARIPVEHYEDFLRTADATGRVLSKEQTGEDITTQYFDTDAYVKSLRIQLERLEAILTDAQKLSDIIELEMEIARVRREIETNTTVLQQYDNLVSYSTVHISLYEVVELAEILPADQDLGTRIANGFYATMNGLLTFFEGFLVVLIAALPVLVILAVIAAVVLLIVRACRKRRRRKKQEAEEKAGGV
ncbi:MAG: DUF4349 domain-containing protein [Christensenellales bacterium]|jgi:hypothetical protein